MKPLPVPFFKLKLRRNSVIEKENLPKRDLNLPRPATPLGYNPKGGHALGFMSARATPTFRCDNTPTFP